MKLVTFSLLFLSSALENKFQSSPKVKSNTTNVSISKMWLESRDVIEMEPFSISWKKKISFWCIDRLISVYFFIFVMLCCCVRILERCIISNHLTNSHSMGDLCCGSKQRMEQWILSNILRKCKCTNRIDAGEVVLMHSRFGKLWRCMDSGCRM